MEVTTIVGTFGVIFEKLVDIFTWNTIQTQKNVLIHRDANLCNRDSKAHHTWWTNEKLLKMSKERTTIAVVVKTSLENLKVEDKKFLYIMLRRKRQACRNKIVCIEALEY